MQLRSGVTFQGGFPILVAPRARASRLERHLLSGAALNTRPGTLTDIVIDHLAFDFHEEFGRIHPFADAMGVTGVDRLQRRKLTIRSGGTRAGGGLLAENARGRSDTDIRHDTIMQGTYARYEQGVTMRRIRFAEPSREISDMAVQGLGLDAAPLARVGVRLRPAWFGCATRAAPRAGSVWILTDRGMHSDQRRGRRDGGRGLSMRRGPERARRSPR